MVSRQKVLSAIHGSSYSVRHCHTGTCSPMAKRSPTPRLALTLSPTTRRDLSYVALRLGANKSQLVDGLLSGPLASLREVLFSVPNPLDQMSADERSALLSRLASTVDSSIKDAVALREGLDGGAHG